MNARDRQLLQAQLAASRDLMTTSLAGGLAASSFILLAYAALAPAPTWWGAAALLITGPLCAFLGAGITIANRLWPAPWERIEDLCRPEKGR